MAGRLVLLEAHVEGHMHQPRRPLQAIVVQAERGQGKAATVCLPEALQPLEDVDAPGHRLGGNVDASLVPEADRPIREDILRPLQRVRLRIGTHTTTPETDTRRSVDGKTKSARSTTLGPIRPILHSLRDWPQLHHRRDTDQSETFGQDNARGMLNRSLRCGQRSHVDLHLQHHPVDPRGPGIDRAPRRAHRRAPGQAGAGSDRPGPAGRRHSRSRHREHPPVRRRHHRVRCGRGRAPRGERSRCCRGGTGSRRHRRPRPRRRFAHGRGEGGGPHRGLGRNPRRGLRSWQRPRTAPAAGAGADHRGNRLRSDADRDPDHRRGREEGRGLADSPPDLAVLDADLTLGLPPHVTAATGIDAMVHAIEAYASASPNNNPLSRSLAVEALRLLGANIRHRGLRRQRPQRARGDAARLDAGGPGLRQFAGGGRPRARLPDRRSLPRPARPLERAGVAACPALQSRSGRAGLCGGGGLRLPRTCRPD